MLHTSTAIDYRDGVAAVVPAIVGVGRIGDEAGDKQARLAAEQAMDEVLVDSFPASDPPSRILALIGLPILLVARGVLKLPARSSAPTSASALSSPLGHSIHIAAAIESYNGETVKPQPRRNDKPAPTDPHLAELLDFRPDKGIIRLHEQRVVILSAAAMGLLQKELIDTLGLETARRVAIRFGYADGYHDAVNLRERSNWSDPVEGVRAGAVLHTLEGIVRTEVSRIDHDASTGRFEEEVIWHDSYVAEQHVHHYGKTSSPVCWSLVGYASGFVSACMGKEIYFRETSCMGQGAKHCVAIGRDAESWGPELEQHSRRLSSRKSRTRSRPPARSGRANVSRNWIDGRDSSSGVNAS